jgi:hypothetical protein
MSVCNFIKVIDGTECIGDSRGTINQNFINLDNMYCHLSSRIRASYTPGWSRLDLSNGGIQ